MRFSMEPAPLAPGGGRAGSTAGRHCSATSPLAARPWSLLAAARVLGWLLESVVGHPGIDPAKGGVEEVSRPPLVLDCWPGRRSTGLLGSLRPSRAAQSSWIQERGGLDPCRDTHPGSVRGWQRPDPLPDVHYEHQGRAQYPEEIMTQLLCIPIFMLLYSLQIY
jgi:hypothetical protein